MFIAKCKDFYDSPHAKPGQPCPAAVWECLFCRQCVVTPTKLPNLLKLLDHIDGQARTLTIEQWRARYGAARAVIAERILPQFSDEVIQAALGPIYPEFLQLKRKEWDEYHRQVTPWEVERYLTML